jgi:hypothetical protein
MGYTVQCSANLSAHLLLLLLDLALLWLLAPAGDFTYVSCDWTISDNPTIYNVSGELVSCRGAIWPHSGVFYDCWCGLAVPLW